MTALSSLWMPILVASIIVFIASSLIHMASPWHKSDYPKLGNEDQLRDAVRPLAIPAGDYMVPRPTNREELKSPAFLEKWRAGPNMILTVLPSRPISMAPQLVQWFLYLIVVCVFTAYIAGRALPPGTPYMTVFGLVTTVSFIGYVLSLWQMTIWYRRALGTTIKATVDGVIYGMLTAGAFGWLWPR